VNKDILKPLNSGIVGDIAPLFLGSEMTTLEIMANPSGFWRSIKHDSQGTDIFLAASLTAELSGEVSEKVFDRPFSFRTKVGLGAAIGGAQSLTAGFMTPSKHGFNAKAFGIGLEYAVNANANTRYFDAKAHYYKALSVDDVDDLVREQFQNNQVNAIRLRAYP